MTRSIILALAVVFAAAFPAHAIPSFARKYGTSCTTCHTVYPKLTPFGEGFRRNGFRFPGIDSDYAKQETITTGAKTATSEGSFVSALAPLSYGFNGQAVFHPDKNSSGTTNHAQADLRNLVAEGHIWAGGTFSDTVSYFGEVTITPGGGTIEHAQVYANDLLGPAHAVNVRVGRGFSNLSSFGAHSSFLADALMPPSGVSALNGATSGNWNPSDHYNGVELGGVIASGRVDYNVGWNAGSQIDARSTEDVYGHVGFKLGGMRLDGEGASNALTAERPWEETAITLDGFAYHALAGVNFAGTTGPNFVQDTINTIGGGVRAQWGSLELNAGAYLENHKRAEAGLSSAHYFAQYDELTYVVRPWIVPGVRFEYSRLLPGSGCLLGDGITGCNRSSDVRVFPGVALLPYPNIKVVVTALFERADGVPLGGSWGPSGGFATGSAGTEFQNVQIYTAFAF